MDIGQGEVIRLVKDMSERLTALEQKLDKMPDTYVQRREVDALIQQIQASNARLDKFDEWRMAQVERQYSQMTGLLQRTDDRVIQTADRSAERAQQSATRLSDRHLMLSTAQIGWILAVLIPVMMWFINHSTFH